jgi:hypothetical protein
MRTQQKATALETTRTRSASRGQSHCRVNCTNPSTLSRKAYLERALRGRAQAAGKVLGTARGDEHGELLHLFALGQHHCLIAADQCTRNARRRRIYENGEAKLFKFASAPTYMRFAMLIATVLGGTAPAAWAGYVVGHQTFIHTVVDMLAPSGSSIARESDTSITVRSPYSNGVGTVTYTVDLSSSSSAKERERLGIKGDEHCSVDATFETGHWIANDQVTKSKVKRFEFDGFPDASIAECDRSPSLFGSGSLFACRIRVAPGAVCYIGTGKCDILLMLGEPWRVKALAYIQANYCSGLAISRPY